jgi:tRNA A-37 threonylcarbamoyl transferase component Bud32
MPRPELAERGKRAPSVPRDSVEGRQLLQTRLSMLARFATLITLGFGLLGGGIMSIVHMADGPWHWRATALHLSGSLVYGSIWAIAAGRRQLSAAVLGGLDLLLVFATALSFALMGWQMPLGARPEMLGVFGIGQALAARAVFIPCTSRRTALVGAVSTLPIVIFTYLYYSTYAPPDYIASPPAYTYMAAILCASVVVMTAITSRVIYGLREKVREARELGQYTLVEKIGSGGMGVVYRAKHAMLRRRTAVKLLLPERAAEQDLTRFEREAQLTSLLSHPNTVSVYDFGRTPDGTFYYAMEYLDGVDLDTLVRLDGPQPPARVVHLLLQACGALAEAHGIGLIHRDIKPQNLLLCESAGLCDVIKVVDFGLVKALPPESGAELAITNPAALSAVNTVVGTPLYMAPEAIVAPASIDARGDLYALGAVAYYLLAGSPPFQGKSIVEICGHHLHTPPQPLSARLGRPVPPELEAVVLSCLAKPREARPESARELAARLAACKIEPAWSDADARRWWSGGVVRAAQKRKEPHDEVQPASSASAGTRTVAVDLAARAAG